MSTINESLVKVRKRKLASGNQTLYLDYIVNGERIRETLGLTLYVGSNPKIKEKNVRTLMLAEELRLKKEHDLVYGVQKREGEGLKTLFLPYYRQLVEERRGEESQGNWGNWRSCLRYLENYCKEDTTFEQITPKWVAGFKNYLEVVEKDNHKKRGNPSDNEFNGLSQNSKLSYFNKLKACLARAVKDHILDYNPAESIENFRAEENERMFLTEEEVKALAITPCKYPQLKRAFLFACLTGLRKSDIEKLTWGEVQSLNGFTRLVFRQKKTKNLEYLDISKAAEKYLGERGDSRSVDLVFPSFKYSAQTSLELRRWALQAGIEKDFTFHASRHTFALLLLNSGADIYTVSKLLGHREIQTTQIYAHILDKKKQDAVQIISNLFE